MIERDNNDVTVDCHTEQSSADMIVGSDKTVLALTLVRNMNLNSV